MEIRDIGVVMADLDEQPHRRFIKSHSPLDGLPYEEAVTYVCVGRDPRDVAISLAARLVTTLRPFPPLEDIERPVLTPTPSNQN